MINSFSLQCFNKKGLEIGGPSPDVQQLGIYQSLSSIDNVDFGSNIWSGDVREGSLFFYGKHGKQIICEATNLFKIEDQTYDVVISSHQLEHVANPIKAMNEFVRVCKPGGIIVLILPIKSLTFDHYREYTPFEHLLADYQQNIDEDDLTHFQEIILNHDLSRDPEAGNFYQFVKRSIDNPINRCFHHHVFSKETIYNLFDYCSITMLDFFQQNSFFALGRYDCNR